jgi:hypothetical protein
VFEASITLALPPVLPPLVVVEPGVQVVEDLDEEVFFASGWYWVRRDGRWYRARDHRQRWAYAEPRFVPPGLRRIPPGHYRRFHHAEWKEEERRRHDLEKERRREWKEEDKERKHEWKDAEREERKHHDHDRDHHRDD